MALRFLNSGYFAGRVGIGTETPGAKLDVDGDVLIKSGEFISWGTVGATSIEGSTVSNKLQFRTNSADRMIINSSGNVGIGTTTPNAKLDVQGTQGQLFSVTDDLSGEIFAVADISGVPIMAVNSSGTSYFDGDLGIGTSTPLAKLEVNVASGDGILIKSADVATLKFKGSGGVSNWGFASTNLTAGDFGLYESNSVGGDPISAGTSRIMVKPGGNVGIGTTNPDAKLEIKTDGDVNSFIKLNSTKGTGNIYGLKTNGVNSDVLAIMDITAGNRLAAIGQSEISFATGGTTRLLMNSSGNVGIGTTNPVAKLHIDKANANSSVIISRSGSNIAASTGVGSITFPAEYNSSYTDYAAIQAYSNNLSSVRGSLDLKVKSTSGNLLTGLTVYGTSSGVNVGIGTTSPAAGLQVASGSTTIPAAGDSTASAVFGNSSSSDNYGVAIGANSSGVGYISSQRTDGTATTYNLAIQSNGGFVGVGTDSPDAPLHVLNDSSANVLAKIRIQGGSTSGYGDIGMQSGYIRLFSNGSMCSAWTGGTQYNYINGSAATTLNSNGLGVGTTLPNFKLEVDGTFGVSDLPGNGSSTSVLVQNQTTTSLTVVNGDFATDSDWVKQTGWTISGGKANVDGTQTATTYLYQGGILPNPPENIEYIITYTVSNYSAGEFRINVGGYTSSTPAQVANGTYEVKVTPTHASSNTNIYVQANADAIGSVDNISVKQVTAGTNQIQTRELGTGAFGPTPVGAYLPLAGGTMTGTAGVLMPDNFKLKFGGAIAPDLEIFHNATNSVISNAFGNLYISNHADDKDIIFECDNGSGASVSYLTLDGSTTHAYFSNPGNVGIGETNPLALLSVGSGSLADTNVPVQISTSGGTSQKWFGVNKDGSYGLLMGYLNGGSIGDGGAGAYIRNITEDPLYFMVSNSDLAMTILANKKVGIGTTTPGEKLDVNGNIKIQSALLSNQENTDIDTGAEVVAQVAHATYTAAFFDFVVKKGTNVRSGTVYACHDGDTTPLVEFTETSTQDLGDTSDVVLSVDISGANMRLLATVASDDWSVKSLIRAI